MIGGLPLLAKASVGSNRRHAVTPYPLGMSRVLCFYFILNSN